MRNLFMFPIFFMLVAGFSPINSQTNISAYKINRLFPVEGGGFWDYLTVDENTSRLFISHGTVVQVISLKDGKLLGTIPDTKGVHGIAIAGDLGKAFISNGKDTSVTIVNLESLAFIAKVRVTGNNPDAILYDPFSKKVFVFNGESSNATVIDAKTNNVIKTIKLEGKPEFSVTDGKGKIYVNIEDKSLISVINASSLKVIQSWSIAPGQGPSGLALDNETHRLFSVCGNKMMAIMDAQNGKLITTVPTGGGTDGVVFDPQLKRAYSSNGEGSMTIVQEENPNSFKILENIDTKRGARTIAIDKTTHHLYLPVAQYEVVMGGSSNSGRTPKPGMFLIIDMCLK